MPTAGQDGLAHPLLPSNVDRVQLPRMCGRARPTIPMPPQEPPHPACVRGPAAAAAACPGRARPRRPGNAAPRACRWVIPAAADRPRPAAARSARDRHTPSAASGPARQNAGSSPSCCARSRSRQMAETRSVSSPAGSPSPSSTRPQRRNGMAGAVGLAHDHAVGLRAAAARPSRPAARARRGVPRQPAHPARAAAAARSRSDASTTASATARRTEFGTSREMITAHQALLLSSMRLRAGDRQRQQADHQHDQRNRAGRLQRAAEQAGVAVEAGAERRQQQRRSAPARRRPRAGCPASRRTRRRRPAAGSSGPRRG